MAKTYRCYLPEQDLLLPPSLCDWLPENHLAYFVSDLIDQADLGAIESYYEQEERGYPPYHPRPQSPRRKHSDAVAVHQYLGHHHDIVLDDGGHMMSHVVASFSTLYPQVAKSGIYMVEDLHTAYWDEYEGGLRKSSIFIELCKSLIDELNADHTRDALPPTDFTKSTLSMHFYDSVAVFEKGSHTKKWAPRIGQE